MQKSILGIFICLIIINSAQAQCPSVSFTMPDSACAGETFTVINTSSGSGTFEWDACTGDLEDQAVNQSIIGPLAYPQQVKAIKANGNYYVFIADVNANSLSRYDYGNSPSNTPVLFNYGNFGGVIENPVGLDVIEENGTFYALVLNNFSQKLIRVDLGSVIAANIASVTDLGAFGFLGANKVKIIHEGTSVYAFTLGGTFVRVEFGNSITNTPVGATTVTGPNLAGGTCFDIGYDCALGKYVGFYYSFFTNNVLVMDFGTTTGVNPTVPFTFVAAPNMNSMQVFKDGDTWHLLTTLTTAGGQFQNFKIGKTLLDTPTALYDNAMAGILNPQSLSYIQDSSSYYGFASTLTPATINTFKWSNSCGPAPAYSTDPVSFQVTAGAGGYQKVTLKLTDANGVVSTFTDSIFVNPLPNSDFTTGSSCEGSATDFIDATTVAVGTVSNWQWDFGDGSGINTQQNPSHVYPGAGTYLVSLITQTSPSCPADTFSQNVIVNPLPVADFTFVDPLCQSYSGTFNDASQSSGGTTVQIWSWDFGDGSLPDSVQNPNHIYDTPGNFDIELIVTTDAGCIDTVTQSITITPTPESSFTVGSTCVGENAAFTNTTSIFGGGTLTYSWAFGDGNISSLTNPVNQYPASAGNYDVTLISTSINGCQDTIVENIRIANRPVPQFSWTPLIVCQGNQVTFANSSVGTGGDTISAYLWDFGDSNNSSLENPFHSYADTGFYSVTLTAISPTNCDSSLTQQVYVIPSPIASFTAAGVCLNLTTTFNPLVITPPGTQVDSIVWSFGDGNGFSGLTSPVHTYTAPGKYNVTMTIYNDLLCTGTFSDSVYVYPLPIADFSSSLSCSGALTTFDGTLSTVVDDTIGSWLWDFSGLGNGSDSITQFSFPNAGTYNITLIATTINGCSDTITSTVSTIQSPDFTFIYDEPCLGGTSGFTYISNILPTPPSNLIWDFGDGTSSSLLSPNHIYTVADTFYVTLQVLNPLTGCASTQQQELIIKPIPQAGFSFADNCEDQPFLFTDTSEVETGSIVNWSWDFGVWGTSSDQNPSMTPSSPGNFPVSLTVVSDEGCNATKIDTLTVFARPVAAFTPDPLYGSPPLTVNFINSTTGGVSYNWDFGDGNIVTGENPSHVYPDTGTFNVTMIAISLEGCIDTAYSTVASLIPNLDIAVNNIYASIDDDRLKLTAQLLNKGNITIFSTYITGVIENGSIITEKWEGTLLPGQALLYNFVSSYEISDAYNFSYYCVETYDPNDGTESDLSNNKLCSVLNSEFEIFAVFPNPFESELNINFNLNNSGPYEIEIFDNLGKLVLREARTEGVKGFNSAHINTNQLSSGNYYVQIRFKDEVRNFKALKLNK